MARPMGDIARAALSIMREQPVTARDLALRLQVPERTIKDICYRLHSAGHARVVSTQRVRHARRPVALYAPASIRCPAFDLATVWQ